MMMMMLEAKSIGKRGRVTNRNDQNVREAEKVTLSVYPKNQVRQSQNVISN